MPAQQAITLSLLFIVGVVNFFDRSSLAIAGTTIRAEMHWSATQLGWLLSAFTMAYGLAQLPLIGLLDRVGTRLVLGCGITVWSLAQLLTGFARAMPSFIVLRVLLGAGEAPFYPSGVRSIREWFPAARRGRVTALMSMSQTLGLAAAPPLLTWIMLAAGWRFMFIALGGCGLVIAAAWLALHRDRDKTAPDVEPIAEPVSAESTWKTLLRQRTVWGVMLGFGGINYTNWLYTAWLPGYLQGEQHLSLSKSGWVAAIPFLAGALGMICSGALADWLGSLGLPLHVVHRCNLVGGMTASAACTFAVAHSRTMPGAVTGISLALFSIHFAGTSGWGYVQAISPLRSVGSICALQNFASFMVASVAPVLTGWLVDRTHSFSVALWICSAVTLLGALSYLTLAGPQGLQLVVQDR